MKALSIVIAGLFVAGVASANESATATTPAATGTTMSAPATTDAAAATPAPEHAAAHGKKAKKAKKGENK